eukprot:2502952-Prymnesium_polylepis.1
MHMTVTRAVPSQLHPTRPGVSGSGLVPAAARASGGHVPRVPQLLNRSSVHALAHRMVRECLIDHVVCAPLELAPIRLVTLPAVQICLACLGFLLHARFGLRDVVMQPHPFQSHRRFRCNTTCHRWRRSCSPTARAPPAI